jgi:hypothetical protein
MTGSFRSLASKLLGSPLPAPAYSGEETQVLSRSLFKLVVVLVATLVPLLLLLSILYSNVFASSGVLTNNVIINDFVVSCNPPAAFCQPPFSLPITTSSLLEVEYTARSSHCASINIYVYVDNEQVEMVGPLSAGQTTGLLDIGPVLPGNHVIDLYAEYVAGCGDGQLSNWGGEVSRHNFARRVAGLDDP